MHSWNKKGKHPWRSSSTRSACTSPGSQTHSCSKTCPRWKPSKRSCKLQLLLPSSRSEAPPDTRFSSFSGTLRFGISLMRASLRRKPGGYSHPPSSRRRSLACSCLPAVAVSGILDRVKSDNSIEYRHQKALLPGGKFRRVWQGEVRFSHCTRAVLGSHPFHRRAPRWTWCRQSWSCSQFWPKCGHSMSPGLVWFWFGLVEGRIRPLLSLVALCLKPLLAILGRGICCLCKMCVLVPLMSSLRNSPNYSIMDSELWILHNVKHLTNAMMDWQFMCK